MKALDISMSLKTGIHKFAFSFHFCFIKPHHGIHTYKILLLYDDIVQYFLPFCQNIWLFGFSIVNNILKKFSNQKCLVIKGCLSQSPSKDDSKSEYWITTNKIW